jgi:predicted outer membrane repeat protein
MDCSCAGAANVSFVRNRALSGGAIAAMRNQQTTVFFAKFINNVRSGWAAILGL